MTTDARPIAIVGGLGKTGGRVAQRLEQLGQSVRPLSRSTTPSFYWGEPAGWSPALQGARAAYATYQPDLADPRARTAIARLAEIALEQGLDHIVLLSGRGEDGARAAEAELAASGIAWTIVRASWFAQNFSENFLVDAVRVGELALPVGGVAEPFVDADDIADVVVAALTGAAPSGRIYEVTGPNALTFTEVARIIANATGRPLLFRSISPDAFGERLRQEGTPDAMIAMLIELFTTTLDGCNSAPAKGVQEALGRAPGSFKAYAERTATLNAWDLMA